jgi:hypothetical protein
MPLAHVCINCCCFYAAVPKQFLYAEQIGSAFQQMRGIAVAQNMRGNFLFN